MNKEERYTWTRCNGQETSETYLHRLDRDRKTGIQNTNRMKAI